LTPTLDERLVQSVNDLGTAPWSGTTYRYTTARRDPLSGEGARRFGGRWNPPDLFPTVYLADPVATCMGEVERAAADAHITVEGMLSVPRLLHTITVHDLPVLDLRSPEACDAVGLETEDLTGDWDGCQTVGHAAWFLEVAGVLAPSAVGTGLTLALFEHRTLPGQARLHSSRALTAAVYQELRHDATGG